MLIGEFRIQGLGFRVWGLGLGLRVASCQLLGASCQLLAASCQVLGASCQLLAASCQMPAARCQVLAASCQLLAASCQLLAASCQLVAGCCWLLAAQAAPHHPMISPTRIKFGCFSAVFNFLCIKVLNLLEKQQHFVENLKNNFKKKLFLFLCFFLFSFFILKKEKFLDQKGEFLTKRANFNEKSGFSMKNWKTQTLNLNLITQTLNLSPKNLKPQKIQSA